MLLELSTFMSQCHVSNVLLLPGSKLKCDNILATLLLENPVGQNTMSYTIML